MPAIASPYSGTATLAAWAGNIGLSSTAYYSEFLWGRTYSAGAVTADTYLQTNKVQARLNLSTVASLTLTPATATTSLPASPCATVTGSHHHQQQQRQQQQQQ
jgi:hypothetical protein